MIHITCIIPSTCSGKILPLLHTCIQSLTRAAQKGVMLKIVIVSSNVSGRKNLLNEPIDNFYLVDPSLGFAQMNNIAIKESQTIYNSDYYLLINDDAWVDANFFSVLKASRRNKKADLVCPLIYKPDGTIDSFGIEYFTSGFARNASTTEINTTLASAACLLIKTNFLKKMRRAYGFYLNPLLHSYYEDTEFSIRTLAMGGVIMKDQALKAYHIGSSSYGHNSAPVMFYTFRNILWVMGLTWPKQYILRYLPVIFLTQLWFIVCSIRDGGWWIYPKIVTETINNYFSLYHRRQRTLRAYTKNFSVVFSPFWFRTRSSGIPLGGYGSGKSD